MILPPSGFRRLQAAGLAFSAAVLLYTVFTFYSGTSSLNGYNNTIQVLYTGKPSPLPALRETAEYFIDFPIRSPFKDAFGELGRRSRILRSWLAFSDTLRPSAPQRIEIETAAEEVALSLFPFLTNYTAPPRKNGMAASSPSASKTPLADLRASFDVGTAGVVIPTGDKTARFASHLIGSLRSVLGSKLPIQVVYAGDSDLSPASRRTLAQTVTVGEPVEFLDLNTVFPDDTMVKLPKEEEEEEEEEEQGDENSKDPSKPACPKPKPVKHEPLQHPFFHFVDQQSGGGWAFKAFAALASRFEKVILLDADAVFLQPPEVMLAQEGFRRTGSLLFHDRLLWKGVYANRHEWWHDQIQRPSAELRRSLVWTENYAEEGDSGAVVLDKGRLDVLMGLLHTCWQNTYGVREEVTYKMFYGDKESWWMGLEMAGAGYAMEESYGAMVGWEKQPDPPRQGPGHEHAGSGRPGQAVQTGQARQPPKMTHVHLEARDQLVKVCSFVIAHVDEAKRLLWYNGSLMKNKARVGGAAQPAYEVPQQWMVGGLWHKGAHKHDMSCMSGAPVHNLTEAETGILQRSIDLAQQIDREFA